MPILKPTMNLRYRRANDDELYRGKQTSPFAIIKMNENAISYERYYVLEQEYLWVSIYGKETVREWRSVNISDESENKPDTI